MLRMLHRQSRHLRHVALIALLLLVALPAPGAHARFSPKKGIWGQVYEQGGFLTAFTRYEELGAGIFNAYLFWDEAAATRPVTPTSPADPAYSWREDLDFAIGEAQGYGAQVAITIARAPAWARSPGIPREGSPARVKDFTDFVSAAARRYPGVRLWRIWDSTNNAFAFAPFTAETRFTTLDGAQQVAPRRYASLLDGAYGALKRRNPDNLVIGGNTTTTGDISPRSFIKWMLLSNGRRPRMDLYGHDPFTVRPIAFGRLPPLGAGFADFADLPLVIDWVDRYLGRTPQHRPIALYLGRFHEPSDHPTPQLPIALSRADQAARLRTALGEVRRNPRIHSLSWDVPVDAPANDTGTEETGGLFDAAGDPKPAAGTFTDG